MISKLINFLDGLSTRLSRITHWQKHDPFENVLFEFPIEMSNMIMLNQGLY